MRAVSTIAHFSTISLNAHLSYGLLRACAQYAPEVETNRPYLKDQCTIIGEYTKNWSGGSDKMYLKQLSAWSKSLPHRREVAVKQIQMLATAPKSVSPDYITACYAAELAAPNTFLKKGEASIFENTDVEALATTLKDEAARAVVHFKKCEQYLSDLHVSLDPESERLLMAMKVRMIMHVHSKKCKERPDFDNLEAIVKKFLNDLYKAVPIQPESKASVAAPCAIEAASASAAGKPAAGLREFQDGQLTFLSVKYLGYDKDVRVFKGDKKGTINSLHPGKMTASVTLDQEAGDTAEPAKVEVSLSDLVDWSIEQAVQILECKLCDKVLPYIHDDSYMEIMKSRAFIAIYKAIEKSLKDFKDFTVRYEPDRRLFINTKVKKEKLYLVPFNSTISITKGKIPSLSVAMELPDSDRYKVSIGRRDVPPEDCRKNISSAINQEFIVPFWCARKVQDSKAANLVQEELEVTVEGNVFKVPIVRAIEDLNAGTELVRYVPKEDKVVSLKGQSKIGKGQGVGVPKGKVKGKGPKGTAKAAKGGKAGKAGRKGKKEEPPPPPMKKARTS